MLSGRGVKLADLNTKLGDRKGEKTGKKWRPFQISTASGEELRVVGFILLPEPDNNRRFDLTCLRICAILPPVPFI